MPRNFYREDLYFFPILKQELHADAVKAYFRNCRNSVEIRNLTMPDKFGVDIRVRVHANLTFKTVSSISLFSVGE